MPAASESGPVRLTSLSHGGGCGCKIAPSVLSDILKSVGPRLPVPPQLLVGMETSDDAAVWQLNDSQVLVATTDFFMPIVDDPYDFGRIAATNAISDVYAMGATPIFALALVGMPVSVLPVDTIARILRGGEAACASAGIPVAGGHTIDSVEPIYGLVALGLAHPDQVRRNSTARDGDVLVLGKPLGVGIYAAALKKDKLDAAGYARMVDTATQLNTPGPLLARLAGVHAMTDVTGFGLAGHLLELCRGSKLSARISMASVPLLPQIREMVRAGYVTGASGRNWNSYGQQIRLADAIMPEQRTLLTDPQTSGGLLVSCSRETVPDVLEIFRSANFAQTSVIGRMYDSPFAPVVAVDP